ncbi:Ger(x)C family spore germination protein [Paenibacillus sp. NEAU-GSW1]|uniref:Ger(x)C family spore germination protein n=1 Tax=Paenibacillus sp. NEAU-GSW1 TaxID=2682486 RepID=UPI0012E14FED|nr:Ger(x)C family spore germination protein [Paenibacillus sp. NEAU-GSW1]MUT68477.1 Ger(x)C family spore germination protein [Paenibacillus sp. NEAU-GSW1]
MIHRIGLLIKIVVCSSLILSTTGCWNRTEVDELSVVMAVGLDKQEHSGDVQFTAQIFKPTEKKEGGTGGGGGDRSYWNLKSTGDTVYSAVQGTDHKAPRKLYFAHNQIVIFSRNIAQEGMQKQIDFFMQQHQNRLNVWILVAQGRADEILEIQPQLEKMPALDIADLIETQVEASQSSVVNLKQFSTRLMSKTTSPIAPFIEVSGKGKKRTVLISGTAVFKKDKLAGQLNKTETRGLLWVIGEVKRGIIEMDCPGGGGKASLNIIRADSKIVPEIKGNKIIMKIQLNEEGILGSQLCPENLSTPEKIAALEQSKADAIRSEVMAAVNKARKLRADIFGFGDAVHRKYPKQWIRLESKWDKVFPDIELVLTIDAKIRRAGWTMKPPVPAKE